MKEEIFKSDRYFTLFDIVVSHGQLLIRSQKNEENKNNIDVVFFNTVYIQIFNRLDSIQISRIVEKTDIIHYNTVANYLNYHNNHLFEIESNNEKYYVAASFVRVFENKLEFNESSLKIEKGREIEMATSLTS